MIDLSFLTDEEQEAILQVLQRDADLKRAEEERVRHLPEKVKDDNQIKNMSGQWFYEAKSKRHRDKIHGADIIRASMRRKPMTKAELSQSKSEKIKNSWVNNVNKEVFMPPELFGAIEETEGESKSSQSPEVFSTASNALDKPQEDTNNPTVLPSKQRKNPFNESTLPEDNSKSEQPRIETTDLSETSKKDTVLASVGNQSKVTLTNESSAQEPDQAPVDPNDLPRQAGKPPVPKARRNVHKTSDVSLKSEDSFPKAPRRIKQANDQGTPPRGILKRSSSSSSTDSEVLRLNQTLDPPNKSGLPTLTILEGVAEKSPPPAGESEGFSQNSLERLKQVRFSSSVGRKTRLQSLELHEGKEAGEFILLDSDYVKTKEDQVGGLDAPRSKQTLPVEPPRSYSPVLNGKAEDRGVYHEGETVSGSESADGLGLPSATLQSENSPPVEPITTSKSPNQICPNVGEEQTVNEMRPCTKTEQLSLKPELSKSTTGQQLPLAKKEDPQVPSVGSLDLEQGKPVLVEGQSPKAASKSDKYAAETLKAADESISKVLDWFKRSSSTGDKETLLLTPQGSERTEETGVPKMKEDNRSTAQVLNLDSPFYERREPISNDYQFKERVSQPGQSSLAKNGGQSSLLPEQQGICSRRTAEEVVDFPDQAQSTNGRERMHFQTTDQDGNKREDTNIVGETESKQSENCSWGQPKALEDSKGELALQSVNSSLKTPEGQNSPQPYVDAGRHVESFLEGGDHKQQAEMPLKEFEGERCGFFEQRNSQQDTSASQGNLPLLQQDESKPPLLTGDQRKVKDIRAFWEREKVTPKLQDKEDLVSESTSVSNRIPSYKKDTGKTKPMGGSSGYVTSESDNEQGKYSLVAFKKVEISDDDSESNDNDTELILGTTRPSLMDKSKESHIVGRTGKIPPSDGKDIEFTELLDTDYGRLRHKATFSSKEDGGLQALENEKTSSALQQKPHFKIHALKEQIDEESKAQRLNPSQFQSLRSFWDVGARPQSKTDEGTAKSAVPSRGNITASPQKKLKEVRLGTGQTVVEDEPRHLRTQEERVKKPKVNTFPPSLLEANTVVSKQVEQPISSQLSNSAPRADSGFSVTKDRYPKGSVTSKSEEETVLPVKEYIAKTAVPSKVQHSLFNSSLQKLLVEASQESLPAYTIADERGASKVQLGAEGQMHCISLTPQHGAVPVDLARNAERPADEVVEVISRAVMAPKADTDAFKTSLERLLKEASDETSSPNKTANISEQAVSPLDKSRFFNKVMERSHDAYPSNQEKSGVVSQTEETRQKSVSPEVQHTEFQPPLGNLPVETKESKPREGCSREEGQGYPSDVSSQQKAFQIPSPVLIVPDARLAIQKGTKSPGKEVAELVTETNVPSRRKCNDLDAKVACLLKESSRMPCTSPTSKNILTTLLDRIPGEGQQRSSNKVTEQTAAASPQMTSLQTETTKRSVDTRKDSGNTFSTVQDKLSGEEVLVLPFKNQKNVRTQSDEQSKGGVASVGRRGDQQSEEVAETLEHPRFKTSLSKLIKEDQEIPLKDTEVPISLCPSQSESSAFHKDVPCPQEVKEIVEKAAVASNSRYDELKTNFQKLLKEDSAILPSTQNRLSVSMDNSNGVHIENEPIRSIDLVCPQEMTPGQEVKETVNKTAAPSKLKQNEFNSGLRKLLEDASQMPPAELEGLGVKMKMQSSEGIERTMELPQEANETIVETTAPVKYDTVFNSSLEKLIKETSSSLQMSKGDSQEVPNDSTSQLAKRSLSVGMPLPVESASSGYRTEVKIPLKGKAFIQDDQAAEGAKISVVPERNVVYQKKLQVNIVSVEAPLVGKEEGSSKLARADERVSEHEARQEGEASNASASLDDGSEKMDLSFGSRRSSTPLAEKEKARKISKIELLLAPHHAVDDDDDEEEEEEHARRFGSDHSDENLESFVGIQRSSTCSEGELNPVVEALKRSSNRQIPSKSLEDIPSATSNNGKVNIPKEDLMLSAEDDQKADQPNEANDSAPGISTAPSFPDNQFSNLEKNKKMSKSVPAFLQDESDRETDTASDSSYPLGRIKKSPSSLTNLSGSSGLASLSSVSTSVMSIYSGDFGSVDVTGNIQFAIDYVEQLKELHIFIAQCKDLAIAEVKKQRSDPYVKSYLLPEKYKLGKRKTSVKKKTLDPVYNEILRYKVDKNLLTSQRLNLSVWHNDTFGRNSFLGEVELDLGAWDWNDKQNKHMNWYPLKPRTPLAALELENRGEIKVALQYIPEPAGGKKSPVTGEVHIWVKECNDLPILRGNKLNSFVKCTILPDTSRKSRQKTRAVAKTTNPVFNHTMVYDGFRPEDLKEACVELTVWDHNKLANHFLGGLRIGLGTGKSYGIEVDWMDSTLDEASLWERMIKSPNKWVEDTLPLRMLMMAKMTK